MSTIHKVAVLIDGGFLRALAQNAKRQYDPDFIEKFAHACATSDEEILRILYYDCAPFRGTVKLPVTGIVRDYAALNDAWLHDLSYRDLFAIRLGILKFRGFVPKQKPDIKGPGRAGVQAPFKDSDFKPQFEQKGVDMRIGLDVASYSANRAVNRIVLVSGDTDCIPALKYARKAGLQTVLIRPNGNNLTKELLAHADFTRLVLFPEVTEDVAASLPIENEEAASEEHTLGLPDEISDPDD